MKYIFEIIDNCEMCGTSSEDFRTIGKRLNSSQGKNPKRKTGITTTIQQCKKCSLIFSNPMPIPDSLQDHYGVPPEEYWNDDYFKIKENYFRGVINWINKIRNFEKDAKALDIGAGIGKCMIALNRAGFETYGIEPSVPFYERAIQRMNIDSKSIQNKAIEEAIFQPDTFDFITFGAVLEHLYHPGEAIIKAMEWLKPGGLIHIEVPSADWLTNKLMNKYYRLKGLDYVANLSPMHEPFHLYEFGLTSFKEHARKNDYEIADYMYMVCDTFLPKALDFIVKPYMKKSNKGMQLAVILQKK